MVLLSITEYRWLLSGCYWVMLSFVCCSVFLEVAPRPSIWYCTFTPVTFTNISHNSRCSICFSRYTLSTHIHTHTRKLTNTHTRIYIYTHTHTISNTQIHTYIHKPPPLPYTHTHTHTKEDIALIKARSRTLQNITSSAVHHQEFPTNIGTQTTRAGDWLHS